MNATFSPYIILTPFLIYGVTILLLYRHPNIKRNVVIHLLVLILIAVFTLSARGMRPVLFIVYIWWHSVFVMLYALIYLIIRHFKGTKPKG